MAAAGSKGFTITNKFAKDMKIGKGYRPTSVDYLKISAYFKCPGKSFLIMSHIGARGVTPCNQGVDIHMLPGYRSN